MVFLQSFESLFVMLENTCPKCRANMCYAHATLFLATFRGMPRKSPKIDIGRPPGPKCPKCHANMCYAHARACTHIRTQCARA